MEKYSILSILSAILCLITRELSCNGESVSGNGLKDSSNRLSSWRGGNCCQWDGISCENTTGIVMSIDLHSPYSREETYENWSFMSLTGEIRPSLMELKSLRYLDSSGNSFKYIPIPKFIGSLKNLQYLNLAYCGFSGAIPPSLGNLSNLQFLDLSSQYYDLFANGIQWMATLVSLKHLVMNHVNLSMVGSNLDEMLNKLPLLIELHLYSCQLFDPILSLSSTNFTSLSVISISHNFFTKFPVWLLNLSTLVSIDVSYNQLEEQISSRLGELPNLQYLDLSGNKKLTGSFSELLRGSWKKIEVLNLASSNFFGKFPTRGTCYASY